MTENRVVKRPSGCSIDNQSINQGITGVVERADGECRTADRHIFDEYLTDRVVDGTDEDTTRNSITIIGDVHTANNGVQCAGHSSSLSKQ